MVEEYYDSAPERELNRFSTPFGSIEYYISLWTITEHLMAHSRIIDVGGGPGNYASEFARQGHDVTVVDISAQLLKIAANRGLKVSKQSVTDLSYTDDSFDMALCLGGALSHLLTREERIQGMRELRRVAKGRVIISVISKFGGYRRVLNGKYYERIDEVVKKSKNPEGTGFTDAYFYTPDTFREELEEAGFTIIDMRACESIAALNSALSDEVSDGWLEKLYSICAHRDVLWYSDHILAVCERS